MRWISIFAVAALLGTACAPQSALMEYRDLADDKLVQRYHETQTQIEATKEDLTSDAEGGRVVLSGIEQSRLTELKRELAKIESELRRRNIRVETPPAE